LRKYVNTNCVDAAVSASTEVKMRYSLDTMNYQINVSSEFASISTLWRSKRTSYFTIKYQQKPGDVTYFLDV
jgi:hypothetical protein